MTKLEFYPEKVRIGKQGPEKRFQFLLGRFGV